MSTSVARAQEALRVGRRARIVQHATLMPARDDDAAQMRFAVEDALNTADFGDCGRLIVVRRLRLNAVPPRAGPALMARALEIAWRSLASRAVPASHPQAGRAEAVFFASRFEARLAWAAVVSSGGDSSAWYWAAALPELKHASPIGEVCASLALVVEALLQESADHAVVALRGWRDETVSALARLLPEEANRRWVDALVRSTETDAAVSDEALLARRVEAARELPAAWQVVVRRLARHAPLPESAATWIAALWLAPLLPSPPTLEQVQAVVTRAAWHAAANEPDAMPEHPMPAIARGRLRVTQPMTTASSQPADAPVDSQRDGAEPHRTLEHASEAQPASWRMESGLRSGPRPPAKKPNQRRVATSLPWLADASPTAHGGLLCLINLLRSLRFDAWLARQALIARQAFVDALFAQVLKACGARADDPQYGWFSQSMDSSRSAILPSTQFVDGSAGLDAHRALHLWRLRMRQALRRHVGMDLPSVVQRPAWVCATSTHLDVIYPLDDVDLRLRRRGLDSDPGWVPWFGRIVAFHFIASELLPEREAQGANDG